MHQFGERNHTGFSGEAPDIVNLLIRIDARRRIVDMHIDDIRRGQLPHIVNSGTTGIPMPRIKQQTNVASAHRGGEPQHRIHRISEQVLGSLPTRRRADKLKPKRMPILLENLGDRTEPLDREIPILLIRHVVRGGTDHGSRAVTTEFSGEHRTRRQLRQPGVVVSIGTAPIHTEPPAAHFDAGLCPELFDELDRMFLRESPCLTDVQIEAFKPRTPCQFQAFLHVRPDADGTGAQIFKHHVSFFSVSLFAAHNPRSDCPRIIVVLGVCIPIGGNPHPAFGTRTVRMAGVKRQIVEENGTTRR